MSDIVIADPLVVTAESSLDTVDDLIHAVRNLLIANQREEINKLAQAVDPGDTTLRVTYSLAGLQPGSRVAIDLEVFHVWSVDPTNTSVVVEPGMEGSARAGHAANSLVWINPRYSKWAIYRALNAELDTLEGEHLYRMRTVDLTYASGIRGYDLSGAEDIRAIYKVTRQRTGDEQYWPEVKRFRYDTNFTTAQFASTNALFIGENARIYDGEPIRVFYKSGFSRLGLDLNDNVEETTGLPREAHNILVYGAAGRLAMPQEVRRTDMSSQGDSRRAADVPVGSPARAGVMLLQLRDRAVANELARLNGKFPPREHL